MGRCIVTMGWPSRCGKRSRIQRERKCVSSACAFVVVGNSSLDVCGSDVRRCCMWHKSLERLEGDGWREEARRKFSWLV